MKRVLAIFLLISGLTTTASSQHDSYVYISSAGNSPDDAGIGIFKLDGKTGELTKVALDHTASLSRYLTVSQDHERLYSIDNEQLYAFEINKQTGQLELLNQHGLFGRGACYVSVDPKNRFAFVANYSGGQVLSFKLDDRGFVESSTDTIQHQRTSVDTSRQQDPHPHMAMPSPDGMKLLVPDLGADLTYVYDVDQESGKLLETAPHGVSPPGTGPRHFVFDQTGKYGYVLNEIIGSITRFDYDATSGKLIPGETISTLPDTNTMYSKSADIHITPDGQYLYASNRGPNTIAIFAIDGQSGKLTPRGWFGSGGKVPRGFGIEPQGKFIVVANKESDNLSVFEIDYSDGSVTLVDQAEVTAPQAVKFFSIN